MHTALQIVVVLVVVLHLYFFVLESFLWESAYGRKVFGLSVADAKTTKTLALNQGVYNLFLAAGLIWGLWLGGHGLSILCFFLGCVFIAGLVGGITANRKILLVQALPAAVGLVLLWVSKT